MLRSNSCTESRLLIVAAQSITKLLLLNNFKESAFIAVDGPASLLKIPLQLQRRLKNIANAFNHRDTISSQLLTQGSLLMQK